MSGPRRAVYTETWWGSRWIQALRRFGRSWSAGLTEARGATGEIRDLTIEPGRIEAEVPGANGATYTCEIRLRTLREATWRRVLRRLAGKALYAAKLLSGEMPRDIEKVFAQRRASLFPRRRHEIEVECSCGQREVPCAHVAAAQFVLAEAFDRDPFLLFELRGRSREQVLAELREIRGAGAAHERHGAETYQDEEGWGQPRPEEYTVGGEDLVDLGFHIAAPEESMGAVRALGPPRSWPQPLPMLRAFAPVYRAASSLALDLAWSGEEEIPASAQLPKPETEELLASMAETMALPTLSVGEDRPSRGRGRRGRRRRGGRRRGRRGKAKANAQGQRGPKGGSKPAAAPSQQGGGDGAGKKRRRRRRRRRPGGERAER